MSGSTKISHQKYIKDLKLNALLEITKAINNNLSTLELLKLYQEILENRLGVGKLVLFHFDTKWTCILKYGIEQEVDSILFEQELLDIREIETITYSNGQLSKNFEIVIPVFHKHTPMAFVLMGDVNQEKLELSAAIKHLPYVQTLTNIIIVAIENKKLYKENIQRVKINKELELAKNMQNMLFPQQLPNCEALQVAAAYRPHEQVGGDYYDFVQLNDHEFIFCIADVSGKGVAAALLMSNMQATLHSLINYTHSLKDIVNELNKRVIANTHSEKFVSFFLAKLDTKSRQLAYINAGHNPPIFHYKEKFSELYKGCTILGITGLLNNVEEEVVDYDSDFTLVCYTDGLTDTFNSNGDTIGPELLKDIIQHQTGQLPTHVNTAILNYAKTFKGENDFPDDIALLTLKVNKASR